MELTNKSDILVFFANAMDTVVEDGSRLRGCTIHYVFLNKMISVQSEPDLTKPIGMQRGKSWVPYEMRDKVRLAPAIYEGTFEISVNSDGKPSLRLIDIAYRSNVRFQPYYLPGLVIPGMIEPPAEMPVQASAETPAQASAEAPAQTPAGSTVPDAKTGKKGA